MNRNRKNQITTILLILVFMIGLCLLLYPSLSNYWNSFHQSRAIASYSEAVSDLDDNDYQEILDAATAYNEKLAETGTNFVLSDEENEEYNNTLNIGGSGIMGYIEIEKIHVSLPIYHGTDAAVLQIAVGHIAGTSLPVETESYHCVLSGHRGLPSAKLFTDLDELEEGDNFTINILDKTYTYEVDQIRIVLPDEVDDLKIEEGKQYVTLVTCTPYGINTHRLLVRGHLVSSEIDKDVYVSADAFQIDPETVAPIIAAPILVVLLIVMLIQTRKKRR